LSFLELFMHKPLPSRLQADCFSCRGLCCVALPFDAFQGFGFDKPAHTPCIHLTATGRCAIHATLKSSGFPGCAAFDCHGAGQRVTQELFGAVPWSADSESATAQAMFRAFALLRPAHESMAMLQLALYRVEDAALSARLASQLAAIDALCARALQPGAPAQLAAASRQALELLREARGAVQSGFARPEDPAMDDLTLADNPSAHRFELRLGDAVAAFAEYRLAPGTLTFTHTEVLPAYEGKGLASKLAKFALGEVRSRGLKAVPVCEFFAGYIGKHPEYQDLLQA